MQGLFEQPGGNAIDIIVLACTHYPLVQAELSAHAPDTMAWIDSGAAIARRTAHILEGRLDQSAPTLVRGLTTGGLDADTRAVLTRFGFAEVCAIGVQEDAFAPFSDSNAGVKPEE
jgi:glutamate racemase